MPLGDRTGPLGMGPMTGRGAGFCAGYPVPGYMNPYRGGFGYWRGFGRGYGRGFGFARGPMINYVPYTEIPYRYVPPTYSAKNEAEVLRSQAEVLKEQLETIQKRIEALEKTQGQE
ncbi:MAG: DUF5320 domain-containing protein [Thermodesulfovibrionales bacterium]